MRQFNFLRRAKSIPAPATTRPSSPTRSLSTSTVVIQEDAVFDDRNRSMTPKRLYLNRSLNSSTSNGSPTSITDLSVAPHPFQRVGASIGYGRLAVRHLLEQHVPGVLIDQELGIVAMFQEIHQSLAHHSTSLQDMARATTASLLAAWARIQRQQLKRSTFNGLTTNTNSAEEDISMAAMFREMRDTLLGTTTASCKGADDLTMMDAMLANILHVVACERQERETPVLSSRDLFQEDEDLSMAAMFREISSLLPGAKSEQQIEEHMVGRVQQIITME